jgi:hypothetical protein
VCGLAVVLYECEPRPLTLKEEHRWKQFGNSVLMITFQHKEWRKLHNEGLHDLSSSPTKHHYSALIAQYI